MASFDVTVSNLTNAQPLSPAAVIAHQVGYSYFAVGFPATAGLEQMAEGGDNSALIAEADADAGVTVTGSGAGPIGPAASETVTIDMLESELPGLRLSVATMLVNTNDAFTGLNGMPVESMAVGDIVVVRGVAYDAGTEAETETAATIPGPGGLAHKPDQWGVLGRRQFRDLGSARLPEWRQPSGERHRQFR
jgi:hypothetical protein